MWIPLIDYTIWLTPPTYLFEKGIFKWSDKGISPIFPFFTILPVSKSYFILRGAMIQTGL